MRCRREGITDADDNFSVL